MPAIAPDPHVVLLTTPAAVAAKMHVEVPAAGRDLDALRQAIQDASAVVLNHLNRDDVDSLTDARRIAVCAVAIRVAMRLWRNPADLGSESYNDHSQSYSDPRLLTGDEIRSLSKSVRRVRGPIMLTPPSV